MTDDRAETVEDAARAMQAAVEEAVADLGKYEWARSDQHYGTNLANAWVSLTAALERERAEAQARHDRIHKELSDRAATQSAERAEVLKVAEEMVLERLDEPGTPMYVRSLVHDWAAALRRIAGTKT